MRRRDPRWRVTYLLRGSSAQWMVRAPDEAEAIACAKYERAGFDCERGFPSESSFEFAFAVPYTTSDAMSDGTSWVSWALMVGLGAFTVLAYAGFRGADGPLPMLATYGWAGIEIAAFAAFAGFILFWAVALPYLGVMMLRERLGGQREG